MRRGALVRTGVAGAAIALALAACQPAKPAPAPAPVPGQFVAFYSISHDGGTFRSPTPFTLSVEGGGDAASALGPDGSLGAAATGLTGTHFASVGFWVVPVRLGDVATIQLVTSLSDGEYGIGLGFDLDGDGDIGSWTPGGEFTSVGGDQLASRDRTSAPSLTIDDSTLFTEFAAGMISPQTLGQLKSGSVPGIGPTTRMFILVQFTLRAPPPDGSALFTSLRLNGVELLVP